MFAVPLARLGHDVTVVDPSADALATLRRRADDRRRRRRGSAASRATATCCTRSSRPPTPSDGYDLALCHYVLEVVDDPAVTLGEIAGRCAPAAR